MRIQPETLWDFPAVWEIWGLSRNIYVFVPSKLGFRNNV
jgi:hypothetical protein